MHPSLMEGYGMALAEAMSFGLPIVATSAGAIPELVKDKVNGIIVNPGNSEELASALKTLIEDAELRNVYGRNNLEKSKTLHTWKDYDEALDNVLVPALETIAGLEKTARE